MAGKRSESGQVILVYITCRNRREAEKIAGVLLRERLIACANLFEVFSLFSWKGRNKRVAEVVVIAKTCRSKFPLLRCRVRELHSYMLPAIVFWALDGDTEYLQWVRQETDG